MTQPDLFPAKPRTQPPITARPHQSHATECPRCKRSIHDPEFGSWIATFGGPSRGIRCTPCWMIED